MTRTFFSKARAERFAEDLRSTGAEAVQIWMDTDGFKQRIFIVKWH
ncbi:MAG: hypothetical protein J6X83_01980 [Methanomicrobium sp.]|nr:hypothetical protein [Methanomicrobium sp.]